MAVTFQKVPLTLAGITYYAYELKKSTASAAGGWLITKADGTIVSDRATYQKLALAATVSKVVQGSTFLPQMKNELEVLKGIRWRIELNEMATGLTKLGADIVAILKGKPAMGGLEDVVATVLTPTEITEGNRMHDILWPLFTSGLVNSLSPSITKVLSLLGTVGDSSEQWLKVFGIVGTVLRKTVAAFAQGGATTYQEAFTLVNTTRSSWSYEEASLFLKEYEEGRTHGLPFAKWYINLIPHEGGFFGSMENIGDMWWENIIKEVIPSVPGAVVDGMKLSEDLVKRCLNDTTFTNEISADIQSAASIFALYRLTYDPSVAGSLAEQIVTAVTPVATTTDKTMYVVGDLVAAKDVLRVREHASATATSKGAVPKGTTGTIIGSSVVADTYRWWPVRWSTGLTGWSAGNYLRKISTATSGGKAMWPMFHYDAQHTGQSLYDTSKNNGTLKWEFRTGGYVSSSAVIAEDGTIYVGSRDNYLYAILPDGTLKWRFATGSNYIESSPTIAVDGTIYIVAGYYFYAINRNGTLKWKFQPGSQGLTSSPAIAEDGTIYIGSWDGYLYALDPDGILKWKTRISKCVESSPAIAVDGTIYIGSTDYYVYAIGSNGALKWKGDAANVISSSPAIAVDGTIYVGSWNNYLYAFNSDGTYKWGFDTSYVVESSPAIAVDGTIYVGSWDRCLYAIKPNGTLKWKFETGSYIYSSAVIAAEGTIYIGSWDSYFYAIGPDGILKWRFKTIEGVEFTPAIAVDGTIYIGAANYLYAIGGK